MNDTETTSAPTPEQHQKPPDEKGGGEEAQGEPNHKNPNPAKEAAAGDDNAAAYPIAIGYPCPDMDEVTETAPPGVQQYKDTPVATDKQETNQRKLDHRDTRRGGDKNPAALACVCCLVIAVIVAVVLALVITSEPHPCCDDDYCYSCDGDSPYDDYEGYWGGFPGYDDYGPISYCGGSHSGLIAHGLDNACSFPLRSMRVDALVIGEIVQVIMTQEFQTIPMVVHPVVTEYQLPLDEQAAVTEFRAEIDTRVIEGVVKERQQAREEFEEAVQSGLNAYLGEQVRPDIFQISVGNLPPGKIVRVMIAYVAPLRSLDSNLAQFVFPTDIAPRFDPWHNSKDPIPPGQSLLNEGVVITLNILSYTPLYHVYSDTHELDIAENGHIAAVRVIDENPLEWDLTVSIETLEAPEDPAVYVEESEEHGLAMMLSVVPDIVSALELEANDPINTKYEFIFIVDRSGSMQGEKITQLKLALQYILLSLLPEDALFNIVSFGSSYEPLFSESQPRQNHLADAVEAVNLFDADLGGTDILLPLQFVLSQRYPQEEEGNSRVRNVFVITDGEVSNTDDVIEYVASARGPFTRVFTLGIGAHASRNLVQGIARAGAGTADFVDGHSDEAIWRAVERQMEVALAPVVDDIEVEWLFAVDADGEEILLDQAPYYPPPLLEQRRLIMYFLAENAPSLPLSMVLTANAAGHNQQQIAFEVTSDSFVPAPQSLVIHQMAARELIRDLEEGRSSLHDSDLSGSELEEQVRVEIVRLGVQYQIASSETSFVAIDNNQGEVPDGRDNEGNGDESQDGNAAGQGRPARTSPAQQAPASAPTAGSGATTAGSPPGGSTNGGGLNLGLSQENADVAEVEPGFVQSAGGRRHESSARPIASTFLVNVLLVVAFCGSLFHLW